MMRRRLAGNVLLLVMGAAVAAAQGPPTMSPCSQSMAGPPPCRDDDGDGLCNSWELSGRLPNGALLPDADPGRPDIYLDYAFMDWAAPGQACTVDADCQQQGLQPNLVCHENHCNHHHQPDPRTLQIVVDSFARHGVALHVTTHPSAIPHSTVITWARAGDPGYGAKAICAGADVQKGAVKGEAVSFFDIKDAYFDGRYRSTHHYMVFGHFNTCLSNWPDATIGNCNQCPADRSTPAGLPLAGSSGIAELPGNDFIVSLAQTWYNPIASLPRNPWVEAGVFMHELGHNLGLHHAGDEPAPEQMPNYLSVMNERYVFSGILQSDALGSSALKVCSSDDDCSGGAICRILPTGGGRCTRIDYSTSTLDPLDESSLDEHAGVSPLFSGLRDLILYNDATGNSRRAPAVGPVDWDGDGVISPQPVTVDLNGVSGSAEVMRSYNDWDHGPCQASSDCPVNAIRLAIHDLVDSSVNPHEPCLRNRCQPQWRAFPCTFWGKKD